MIKKDFIWPEPDSVILDNRVILALVSFHASNNLIFKFAKVLLHSIIERVDLLLNVERGEVIRSLHTLVTS